MQFQDNTVDLLILGAGMAGLTAAAKAIDQGASVVVVEKGPVIGGSANYAGFIWTAPSVKVMHDVNPKADQRLSSKLVEDYESAMQWVRSLGVDVKEPISVLGFGVGCQADVANYLQTCQRRVKEKGELILESAAEELIIEEGRVCGAKVRTQSGQTRTVRAGYTLLATGGFGGNPELRAERIHPLAKQIALRANPYSVGDGMQLALKADAQIGHPDAGFYGHLIPSQLPLDDPNDFVTLSFYHSEHSLLINIEGQRFCDETVGDHLSTMSVLDQPEARALMIYDQRVHDEWMMTPYVKGAEPTDRFKVAHKRGARCAVADTIEDFLYLPEEWGYRGDDIVRVLKEYNERCESGAQHIPARALDRVPLLNPPFYVIEVVPALTFTMEGMLIDGKARVLNSDSLPIPGLLAAGADSGGVFDRAYAGGLANALVFGLQAAVTATGR